MAVYRTALISFIDILGFREIVAKRSCQEIERILSLMKHFSGGDDTGEQYDAKVVQFSDSIIRIRPIDSKANEDGNYGVLFHELCDIGMMQGDLANQKVSIRGAVTLGQIAYESGHIFGPGFIRAYDLESRIANFPRIILDYSILKGMMEDSRLFSDHNSTEDEYNYLKRQVKLGSDGIHFVDYIRVTMNNMDDPEYSSRNFLLHLKQHILESITAKDSITPESTRYLWAARYYNEYLDNEIKRDSESEDLWISTNELGLLHELS